MRAALVLSAVAALCLSARTARAEDGGPQGVFERDAVEVQAPAGLQIGKVVIDNRFGDISVRGHDHQSIAIQSFKRADDKETLERLVVSLVPDGKGQVAISTSMRAGSEYKPVRSGSVAVDLVVFVPRSAALSAQIWRGELLVSKIDNGATLLADEGRINVKHVSGTVASDIRDGQQEFAELFGALEARGIKGSLHMDTVRGSRLVASMVRGQISGARIRVQEMDVKSVFGDVDLRTEFVPGGKYTVSSRRGDVTLRFYGETSVAMQVVAKDAVVGQEMSAEGTRPGAWRGHFGVQGGAKVRPAQLEVRAGAGTVTLRHF